MNASERLEQFFVALGELDDDAIFISVGSPEELRPLANDIDAREEADVPLRGLIFGVKDNIDVVGMATTAGCPAYAYEPDESAAVVRRLVAAGALPVAKTNLDQFATGLVGTRSPYGTPRNPFDPGHVPGGSSCGSAVATARGLVDFALGTDTAGSGRVPAAFCGLIGVKPTLGRLSTHGVVPAVRTLDCVSIFARELAVANAALTFASGFEVDDPYSRSVEPGPSATSELRFGVLDAGALEAAGTSDRMVTAYLAALEQLPSGQRIDIDFGPFAAAGDLLYGGPWVAERTEAVGEFIADHLADPTAGVDPTVGAIISAGNAYTAVEAYTAAAALARLRRSVDLIMDDIDVLVLPTTPHGATLAEVAADPVGVNSKLGRFTTFVNLLDFAGLSIPVADPAAAGGVPLGVSLYAPAWSDEQLMSVASEMLRQPLPTEAMGDGLIPLVVAGAHLKGQPLEWQLTDLGAVWQETTQTASTYRLFALPGGPPKKPGVVFDPAGAALEVDVWAVTPAALGKFLTMVPAPLALGTVTLHDGRELTGFVCEPRAMDGATEVTSFGGWRGYVDQLDASENGQPDVDA